MRAVQADVVDRLLRSYEVRKDAGAVVLNALAPLLDHEDLYRACKT
jgi:hypothetical protein